MPKFVIEREIAGAGHLSDNEIQAVSLTACCVLTELGPEIQWIRSYVTDDKLYCVYIAKDEEIIREHARRGQFPANEISQVRRIIDPTTAEVAGHPGVNTNPNGNKGPRARQADCLPART